MGLPYRKPTILSSTLRRQLWKVFRRLCVLDCSSLTLFRSSSTFPSSCLVPGFRNKLGSGEKYKKNLKNDLTQHRLKRWYFIYTLNKYEWRRFHYLGVWRSSTFVYINGFGGC